MRRNIWLGASLLVACASLTGCNDDPAAGATNDGGGDTSDDGGGSNSPNEPDGPRSMLDEGVVGQGIYDVETALPVLPRLENVVGVTEGDSVRITFLPVDDARDYRVYVLPADGDIKMEGDRVRVQGAIYRCAGNREAPQVDADSLPEGYNLGARTLVDNEMVGGYLRRESEAVLGHVYYKAGEGRVPVYALGDPTPTAENVYFITRVDASRAKVYTTSESERASMLAAGFRDDGIVFYVPAQASGDTQAVSTRREEDGERYYFTSQAERMVRGSATEAFQVLKAAALETQPLYRVHYTKYAAVGHDELVYGKTFFERARFQGWDKPETELLWAGLAGPTTLVVEALDSGCPYPGRLAATAIAPAQHDAATESGVVDYPAAITPEAAQAQASFNELYINGQHDTNTAPRAVARAFLKVEPQAPEVFDWFAGFAPSTPLSPLAEADCAPPMGMSCYHQWRQVSSDYDVHWHTVETDQRAIGQYMGELWVRYADRAADTNGKFRITPLAKKGNIAADSYLHATMEVTSISTARRYPQIMISDRAAPVQNFMDQGKTILLQVFRNWPNFLEVQICDHRKWDVNDQCPYFQFYERLDADGEITSLSPAHEVGERTGPDKRTRFDFFVSTTRAYVMLNRRPYGCVDLPATGAPTGEVTVTFGDVLYHSAADVPYGFHLQHQQFDTERHFDNLGFSSGVPAPQWDSQRFPCVPASSIDEHR